MSRTTIALAALLPVALASAHFAGGVGSVVGAGVLVGYAVAALAGLFGVWGQRRVLASKPQYLQSAQLADFMAKLVLVLTGGLLLRNLPALAERADWRAYLLTFALVSLVALALGTVDLLRDNAHKA